jgi:hypothetical protein
MKYINDMNLAECLEELSSGFENDYISVSDTKRIADRIYELTRWIPVSERMPTHEDGGLNNKVLVLEVEKQYPRNKYLELVDWFEVGKPDHFYTTTHWRRTDLPEAVQ